MKTEAKKEAQTTLTARNARSTAIPGVSDPRVPSSSSERNSREQALFDALATDGKGVAPGAIRGALELVGLRHDDPRLCDLWQQLGTFEGGIKLSYAEFVDVIRPALLTFERAAKRQLVIPEFSAFCTEVRSLFEKSRAQRGGQVADYIPQLSRVEPEQYAVAMCTIDGQRLELGDSQTQFCVQSCCKPINYCLALEHSNVETVHGHVGCEPSGQSFNELTLNSQGRPHNPLINSGAIMSCALIRPDLPMSDRFDHVMSMWARLSGGQRPGFSNPTYLSERGTADRNFALSYFMRENGAFPPNTDVLEVLEFYLQCCSLELNADSLSVVAATLANGGLNPLSGKRVLTSSTVQRCLSLMYSCGMYDFSGEWGFTIGLPAKSGVSGAILVVIPNVLGLCIWSPRLDEHGNSVRGIEFCRELVSTYNFHNYDNIVGGVQGKKDPRHPAAEQTRNVLVDLCWAASEGDLAGIQRLVASGVNLDAADYDGRTALHLAASEGRREVVAYFVSQGVELAPCDRWGNTPLDDAKRGQHSDVVAALERAL